MSLLKEHADYIEQLRKEFYSLPKEQASNCMLETMHPKYENLRFGFIDGTKLKAMVVIDLITNERIEL